MDCRTGEIYQFGNDEDLGKALAENSDLAQIQGELTKEQRESGSVSLDDHESPAGIQLQHERKIRYGDLSKSQKRNMRRRLK